MELKATPICSRVSKLRKVDKTIKGADPEMSTL